MKVRCWQFGTTAAAADNEREAVDFGTVLRRRFQRHFINTAFRQQTNSR